MQTAWHANSMLVCACLLCCDSHTNRIPCKAGQSARCPRCRRAGFRPFCRHPSPTVLRCPARRESAVPLPRRPHADNFSVPVVLPPQPPPIYLGFDGEGLNGFGENQLAVYPLRSEETNLPCHSKQFIQPFERASATVANPIILQVTECNGFLSGFCGWSIGRGVIRAVEDGIRQSGRNGRIPDVVTSTVLQLPSRNTDTSSIMRGSVSKSHSFSFRRVLTVASFRIQTPFLRYGDFTE